MKENSEKTLILEGLSLDDYVQVLKNCPSHTSPEFIEYLREHNRVVDENESWILIENCKYHSDDGAYYTAFLKTPVRQKINVTLVLPQEWSSLWRMYQRCCDGWEIKIKSSTKRSIDRFHVHFIQCGHVNRTHD